MRRPVTAQWNGQRDERREERSAGRPLMDRCTRPMIRGKLTSKPARREANQTRNCGEAGIPPKGERNARLVQSGGCSVRVQSGPHN